MERKAVYLDCNATTPLDPRVRKEMLRFFDSDFGNAGSRTHQFGTRAKQASQRAREQVAAVVKADGEEVIFTSGATESNNLAILGLGEFAKSTGRRHIISSLIEHKAVLEPLEHLTRDGFEVTLLPPSVGGFVEPELVAEALRSDTLLVSLMHANNETGVLQPITEVAKALADHPAFFHVDAAQGFGKDLVGLENSRVDLISVSAHKLYGPKGVGALVARKRGFESPPLNPLLFGGGQERGLRPGTLPVPLVVGLGAAAALALVEHKERRDACLKYRKRVLDAFGPLHPRIHGDQKRVLPHVLNLSFAGVDSEALMVALKDIVAISNGSACTSASYTPSHVLKAMSLPDQEIMGAIRLSWYHATDGPDWNEVAKQIKHMLI